MVTRIVTGTAASMRQGGQSTGGRPGTDRGCFLPDAPGEGPRPMAAADRAPPLGVSDRRPLPARAAWRRAGRGPRGAPALSGGRRGRTAPLRSFERARAATGAHLSDAPPLITALPSAPGVVSEPDVGGREGE